MPYTGLCVSEDIEHLFHLAHKIIFRFPNRQTTIHTFLTNFRDYINGLYVVLNSHQLDIFVRFKKLIIEELVDLKFFLFIFSNDLDASADIYETLPENQNVLNEYRLFREQDFFQASLHELLRTNPSEFFKKNFLVENNLTPEQISNFNVYFQSFLDLKKIFILLRTHTIIENEQRQGI